MVIHILFLCNRNVLTEHWVIHTYILVRHSLFGYITYTIVHGHIIVHGPSYIHVHLISVYVSRGAKLQKQIVDHTLNGCDISLTWTDIYWVLSGDILLRWQGRCIPLFAVQEVGQVPAGIQSSAETRHKWTLRSTRTYYYVHSSTDAGTWLQTHTPSRTPSTL